jgi:hypothetical protein
MGAPWLKLPRSGEYTGVGEPESDTRLSLRIAPHPVTGSVVISVNGRRATRAEVFSLDGRLVRDLLNPPQNAADPISWDTKDSRGNRVAGGVYFLRVVIGNATYHRPMTVIR